MEWFNWVWIIGVAEFIFNGIQSAPAAVIIMKTIILFEELMVDSVLWIGTSSKEISIKYYF